jgi:hypothetical protein
VPGASGPARGEGRRVGRPGEGQGPQGRQTGRGGGDGADAWGIRAVEGEGRQRPGPTGSGRRVGGEGRSRTTEEPKRWRGVRGGPPGAPARPASAPPRKGILALPTQQASALSHRTPEGGTPGRHITTGLHTQEGGGHHHASLATTPRLLPPTQSGTIDQSTHGPLRL